ncbi:MAG: SusC/RagA family TonB-linked outer membrane protein [Sphingobacterium composti]
MKLKNIYTTIFIILLLVLEATAQVNVTGKVVDENNNGLSGVTILLASSGRSIGITNNTGAFSIRVEPKSALLFKLVGFDQKRVTLGNNQTSLTVMLNSSETDIDEVVVRGYVARSKEVTTGSSFTLTEKDIRDVPVSLDQLLQGKVPGLNIQVNTGAPGFRGTTQIRGLSTLNITGSGDESFLQPTSPLYVIDGVPLDADRASEYGFQQQGPGVSPLSMIPPEDVASIEILKDAQATSLYGSLAAYGVIIITTKRGNSEVPRVRYTNNTFVKTPPKLRETLGGNLERQLKLNQIIDNALYQSHIDQIITLPHLSDSLNAYFNNSTNWQSLYYNTTYNHSHNVNIDGGNPQLSYKANVGYFTEKGIIRNTGFDRYSGNLRMEFNPDRKFKFIGQVYTQLAKQNKGDGLGLLQTGVANSGLSSTLLPPPSFYLASSEYVSSLKTNNDNNTRLIRPYIEGAYELFTGLRLSSSLSYEFVSKSEDTFTPAAANNQFSSVYAFTGRETQLYNRNIITYSKSINEKHNLFFNFFNELRNIDRLYNATRQQRTPNDQFQGPIGFDGFNSRGGGVLSNFLDQKALSFAIAGSYDFSRRYVVDLSYRVDGNSGNGFNNLYTKNPAVGVRWNLHNEPFMKDQEWLRLGSVRGSWGVNVMPNSTLDRIYGRYNVTGKYNNTTGVIIDYGQIPNPYLKPTTSTQYNFGLDLNVFNNKFEVIYDTYYKNVDNLLFPENLNNTTGFNVIYANGAAIANYGHEIAVTLRPITTADFNWTVTFNGAYNKDVLLKLPSNYNGQYITWDNTNGQNIVFRVGTSTMSNYLLINKGVYSTDEDVPVDPASGIRYRTNNGTYFQAGDPIWEDRNGDYILDSKDYVRTGNSQPLITGGFATTLNYKNWSVNMYASYTAIRTILNNALAQRMGLMQNPFGVDNNNKVVVPLDNIDMWRNSGDIAKYPYAYDYARAGSIRPFRYDQTLWEEDGSYFKLNNLIVSYMFKRDFMRRFGLANLRVYASTDNLITFSKYSGPNPENVSSMGRDLSNGYPLARTYNIGLNLEF